MVSLKEEFTKHPEEHINFIASKYNATQSTYVRLAIAVIKYHILRNLLQISINFRLKLPECNYLERHLRTRRLCKCTADRKFSAPYYKNKKAFVPDRYVSDKYTLAISAYVGTFYFK